jgi:hypothetical protein
LWNVQVWSGIIAGVSEKRLLDCRKSPVRDDDSSGNKVLPGVFVRRQSAK